MSYQKAMRHHNNPRKWKMTPARRRGNQLIFGIPATDKSRKEIEKEESMTETTCYPATEGLVTIKETQPMSDTLQEREDQIPASAHRVNSSGNCSISGCPCRGWSAQESVKAIEYKSPRSGMSGTCLRCFNDGREAERRNLRAANFDAGFATPDIEHTCQPSTEHQPAARGGGREWRYREGSGVIYDAATVPTKIIARYVDADVAQQIIIAHDLYQPMLDALKEVGAMLDKELARDYESQSWAKKVRAVLIANEQRSTSE